MRRLLPVLAGFAVTAAALAAPSPVGKWSGKAEFKMPPTPANADVNTIKMMDDIKKKIAAMRFPLLVNANKTWSITMTNPMSGQKTTQTGTWSQAGNKVTFLTDKKSKGNKDPMVATLSANGKTLVAVAPKNQGKITFTKA